MERNPGKTGDDAAGIIRPAVLAMSIFIAVLFPVESAALGLPGFLGGASSVKAPDVPEANVVNANIGPFESIVALAMVEGLALGNAWLAREVPVPYGIGMVVLSPFATMKNLNGWGNATLIAGVIGLGLYDALNHGQDKAWRDRRFWVTYAGLHLILLPAYTMDFLTGGKQGDRSRRRISSSLDLDPGHGAVMLTAVF